MKHFYSHTWKSFIRNERWRRGLLTKILLSLIVLYFLFLFIMLGMNLSGILAKAGGDPVVAFNSVLILYLVIDFFLRCLFQPFPALEVFPYLRFNFSKSRLIRYILNRSRFNLFNLYPWFIIIPFTLNVLNQRGLASEVLYPVFFLLLMILNNDLAVLTGLLAKRKAWFFFLPILLLTIVTLINQSGRVLSDWSSELGHMMTAGNPVLAVILIGSLITLRQINLRLLSSQFYLDSAGSSKMIRGAFNSFGLNRIIHLGETSTYLSLEISLMTRNKRPRQSLVMIPFLVLYLIFLFSKTGTLQQQPLAMLLFGVAVISAGASMYGQFIFSWESTYFDFIMARKINFPKYVKAKYYLMCTLSIAVFIPVAIFFQVREVFSLTLISAFLLYILGVNNFIILFFGTLNDGRIDLSKSRFFNFQGVSGSQFLLNILTMFPPLIIFKLVESALGTFAGELAIALPGIVFTVFHDWWIKNVILVRIRKRKHRNLEGFRKLSY
jgi:hypothetical protein